MAENTTTFKDREWKKALNKLEKQFRKVVGGVNEYVKWVSPIAFRDVQKHFDDEKGPDGKWKSWSDSYKKFLRSSGLSGNNILQMSGRLRNSVKPAIGIKGKLGEVPILVNNAKTKGGFPYAYAHDNGAGKLPQREFMWLSNKAQDNIAKATLLFLLKDK